MMVFQRSAKGGAVQRFKAIGADGVAEWSAEQSRWTPEHIASASGLRQEAVFVASIG